MSFGFRVSGDPGGHGGEFLLGVISPDWVSREPALNQVGEDPRISFFRRTWGGETAVRRSEERLVKIAALLLMFGILHRPTEDTPRWRPVLEFGGSGLFLSQI